MSYKVIDLPSGTLCPVFLSVTASADKTPHASLTHHPATSHANKSQTLELTENDEEPVGDRWDEEEDWGSLEVGFLHFWLKEKITNKCHFFMVLLIHNCNFESRSWWQLLFLKGARERSHWGRWLEHWLVRNVFIQKEGQRQRSMSPFGAPTLLIKTSNTTNWYHWYHRWYHWYYYCGWQCGKLLILILLLQINLWIMYGVFIKWIGVLCRFYKPSCHWTFFILFYFLTFIISYI